MESVLKYGRKVFKNGLKTTTGRKLTLKIVNGHPFGWANRTFSTLPQR